MQIEGETQTVAEAIGESVGDRVTEELKAANADAHAAEQNAKRIAEAAMESERGNRIEKLERENEECRQKLLTMEQSLSEQKTMLDRMDGSLGTLLLAATAQSTPIPEPLEQIPAEPEIPAETLESVEPEAVPEVEVVEEKPAQKKRRRFI